MVAVVAARFSRCGRVIRCSARSRSLLLGPGGPAGAAPGQRLRSGELGQPSKRGLRCQAGWRCWLAEGLVVPRWAEGLPAQLGSARVEDLDVQAVDEDDDAPAAVGPADGDVVQPPFVPEGDGAFLVQLVVADLVAGGVDAGPGGIGLFPGGVGVGVTAFEVAAGPLAPLLVLALTVNV